MLRVSVNQITYKDDQQQTKKLLSSACILQTFFLFCYNVYHIKVILKCKPRLAPNQALHITSFNQGGAVPIKYNIMRVSNVAKTCQFLIDYEARKVNLRLVN